MIVCVIYLCMIYEWNSPNYIVMLFKINYEFSYGKFLLGFCRPISKTRIAFVAKYWQINKPSWRLRLRPIACPSIYVNIPSKRAIFRWKENERTIVCYINLWREIFGWAHHNCLFYWGKTYAPNMQTFFTNI